MHLIDQIRAKRDEIYAIARKHKAEKLWVFGSVARREERPDSDIDFLVQFSDRSKFGDMVGVSDAFLEYFKRKVDVVSSRGINPHVERFIWKDAVSI